MEKLKVAGVKFNNYKCDGGENRQNVIENLYKHGSVIILNLKHTRFKNPETNSWENAIKCIEKSSGEVVGWIPKSQIKSVWEKSSMTGIISLYKDNYSVAIVETIKPSAKLYHTVKDLCEENNWSIPAYDKRAFIAVLSAYKKLFGQS